MICLVIAVIVTTGTGSLSGCHSHVGAMITLKTTGSDIAVGRVKGAQISWLGMTAATIEQAGVGRCGERAQQKNHYI